MEADVRKAESLAVGKALATKLSQQFAGAGLITDRRCFKMNQGAAWLFQDKAERSLVVSR